MPGWMQNVVPLPALLMTLEMLSEGFTVTQVELPAAALLNGPNTINRTQLAAATVSLVTLNPSWKRLEGLLYPDSALSMYLM
jgi:hypothetical protein